MNEERYWKKYELYRILFRKPFFKYLKDNSNYEILIITDQEPSDTLMDFMNLVFQLGQSLKKRIIIKVYSPYYKKIEEIFFRDNPTLEEYIAVNKDYDSQDYYGYLELNDFSKETLLESSFTQDIYNTNYYFLDIVSSSMQELVLNVIEDKTLRTFKECIIISEQQLKDPLFKKIEIITLDPKIESDPKLENMGLNVHISWFDRENIKLSDIKKSYREDYNHSSSLESALSIIYKLNEIGIDTDNLEEAANALEERLSDLSVIEDLAYLEHRRWILEKAASSFVPLTPDNYKVLLKNHNLRNFNEETGYYEHGCLVPSTKELALRKLSDKDLDEGNYDLSQFDPLDQVSLRVHEFLKENLPSKEEIRAEIDKLEKQLLLSFPKSLKDKDYLSKFFRSLDRALKGSKVESERIEPQLEHLKSLVSRFDEKEKVEKILEEISRITFPITEYNRRVDYKELDSKIVEHIPYIITYNNNPVLAQGFTIDNGSTALFDNVGGVFITNPKEISFLVYINSKDNLKNFLETFKSASVLIRERISKIKFNLAIAVNSRISTKSLNFLKTNLSNYKDLSNLVIKEIKTEKELFEFFKEFILDLKKEVLDKEDDFIFNGTPKIMPKKSSDYKFKNHFLKTVLDYFEFDSDSQEIYALNDNTSLKFLEGNKSFLTIEENFKFRDFKILEGNATNTEKEIYELWELITGETPNTKVQDEEGFKEGLAAWNELSKQIARYFGQVPNLKTLNEQLEDINVSNYGITNLHEFSLKINNKLLMIFYNIIELLKKKRKFLEIEVTDKTDNFTYFKVTTKFTSIEEGLTKITQVLNILLDKEFLNQELIENLKIEFKKNEISIKEDNLSVRNLDLDLDMYIKESDIHIKEPSIYAKRKIAILEAFEENGIIRNLEINENIVSFDITNSKFKKLMSRTGDLLELYTYYELKNANIFDDLATGISIIPNTNRGNGVINELDIIGIKRFKTYIFECKQRKNLFVEDIYKVLSTNDIYSVNSQPFIIQTNLRKNDEKANMAYKEAFRKAKRFGARIISQPNEINKISETIKNILEEQELR